MADAPALGAGAPQGACRFESDLAYDARTRPLRARTTATAATRT
jgi:hypothetical protein